MAVETIGEQPLRTRPHALGMIVLAFAAAVPWLSLRFQGAHPEPTLTAALAGLAPFVLFAAQLFAPWDAARGGFAVGYMVLTLGLLAFDQTRRAGLLRLPREARAAFRGAPTRRATGHRASPSSHPTRPR